MSLRLNILLVDDDDHGRDAMRAVLIQDGHEVIAVSSAEAVEDEGARASADLLITDLSLPAESGMSLSRRFRASHPRAGIIMITGSARPTDRAEAYRSGVDIYLSKPVEPVELLAAVQALAHRIKPRPAPDPAPVLPELILDPIRLRLSGPLGSVDVSNAEMLLLSAMARAPGQRLENWQIIELLGEDPAVYRKTALEVRLVRLRKKFRDVAAQTGAIRAVRGSGYQLCVTVKVI